jgi:hypothetical protein
MARLFGRDSGGKEHTRAHPPSPDVHRFGDPRIRRPAGIRGDSPRGGRTRPDPAVAHRPGGQPPARPRPTRPNACQATRARPEELSCRVGPGSAGSARAERWSGPIGAPVNRGRSIRPRRPSRADRRLDDVARSLLASPRRTSPPAPATWARRTCSPLPASHRPRRRFDPRDRCRVRGGHGAARRSGRTGSRTSAVVRRRRAQRSSGPASGRASIRSREGASRSSHPARAAEASRLPANHPRRTTTSAGTGLAASVLHLVAAPSPRIAPT